MKKALVIVVILLLAVGYFYRRELVAAAPPWAKTEIARLAPGLAARGGAAAPATAGARSGGHRGSGGPVAVNIATATEGVLPILRSTIGTVVAVDSTEIAPQTSGKVMKILVASGDEVKQGDLLVQLDDTTIRAQIAKDEAQIAKDQATLDNAKANYDRTRRLVGTGVATAQAGDDAESAVKVAEGTLAVDKAAHAVDEAALAETQIRAPYDGRLGVVKFSPGAFVSAGTSLVRLTRMKPVLVEFSLPVDDLALLRSTRAAGTLQVNVSPSLSEGDNGPRQSGKVVFIDNAVNASSATVTLRASLPNDDENLWPGQPVSVEVQAGTTQKLVLVPNVAVMPQVGGSVVYVVKADGTAESRPVNVVLHVGNRAGISKGITAGEKVVVEGQAQLIPGAKLRILPARTSGQAGTGRTPARKPGQADLGSSAVPVTKS